MKSENNDILVILPAYNEAKSLGLVLEGVQEALPGAHVVVVDDGSEDGTYRVSEALGVQVLRHPFNLGYGVALQTGYKFAYQGDYTIILQMDGDGQHDPKFLAPMAQLIRDEKADVVLGTRYHSQSTYKTPIFRRMGMILFHQILRLLTHKKISDPTSGFQAFHRKVLKFFTSDVYPWDFPDADVLLMLHYANFQVKEVPVMMYPSPAGNSMHQGFLKPFYYILVMCLSIVVTFLRGKKISHHFLYRRSV